METIFSNKTILKRIFIIQFILAFILNSAQAFEIKCPDINHSIFIGGTFQLDYRNISDQARADSRYDIRRARLKINGNISNEFSYKLSFEFQGNDNQKLVDAFGNYVFNPGFEIRFGQFKMPFSREWQIKDSDFSFAERSIGFSLQPGRDIGLMIGGQFFDKTFSYNIGAFNGDGIDGSSRGNQKDDPELAARLLIQPFSLCKIPVLPGFFSGISYTEGRIDLTNVSVDVKSTGMIGTNRSLYILNSNTKFGVLLEVDKRKRTGLEGGLIYGPVAFFGEYQRYQYIGLKSVREEGVNANFYSWYTSLIINLTGDPINDFSQKEIKEKTKTIPGILQLALRREYFSGDSHWIMDNAFNATREADAYSLALSYIVKPYYKFLMDYTVTDISDPIRIRINPDGTIEYMSSETSLTLRFQINF